MNEKKSGMNQNHLNELWKMRNMSVKEMFESISKNDDLKFFLIAAGIWWVTKFIIFVAVFANLLYLVYSIFHLVLS